MPYSGNPNSSIQDKIRFLSGDTDPTSPYLSDDEVAFLSVTYPSTYKAATTAVEAILAKLARDVDYKIGPEQVSASQRYEQYKALADTIRATQIAAMAAPAWEEPGSVPSNTLFGVGMHDNGCGPYG